MYKKCKYQKYDQKNKGINKQEQKLYKKLFLEYSGNYPTCDEKVKGVELKQLKRQLPTNSKTARLQNSNNNPRYNHSKTAEIKEDISNAVRKNRHYLQRSKNKFNS